MTITYPNGTVLEAIVLKHEGNSIRAIAPGCEDVLVFNRVHGTWISEELEPVTMEFPWQRRGRSPLPNEDDCVCPKSLAAFLIQLLRSGREVVVEPNILVEEGSHMPISGSELRPR